MSCGKLTGIVSQLLEEFLPVYISLIEYMPRGDFGNCQARLNAKPTWRVEIVLGASV